MSQSQHSDPPAPAHHDASAAANFPAAPAEQPLDPRDEIFGQMGLFFRRLHALHHIIRPADHTLERPAYILLGIIACDGPVRLTTLATSAQLNLSTISRQVSALESAGFIVRDTDPADGRASLVQVSEAGRIVLERIREQWRTELATILSDWDETEQAEFARLFTRLNEALAARCAMEDS